MAYSIKNIKGNWYLYYQESKRIEGKVKTTSRYIGPLPHSKAIAYMTRNSIYNSGVFEEPSKSDGEIMADLRKIALESRKKISENQKIKRSEPKKDSKKQVSKVNPTKKNKFDYKGLRPKINLSSRYYSVSEKTLKTRASMVFEKFIKIGINQKSLPEITIKHGGKLTSKKNLTGNGYTVTAPKVKGFSTKLRQEVVKCSVKASLDLLEKSNPSVYGELERVFKENHQNLNSGIKAFLSLINRQRMAEAKGIAMKHFGNVSFLKKMSNFKYSIKPSSFGLVDFDSTRKSWQDDFAITLTEKLTTKYRLTKFRHKTHENTQNAYNRAKREYQNTSILRQVQRARKKRNLKKYEAKLKCTKAALDNAITLDRYF